MLVIIALVFSFLTSILLDRAYRVLSLKELRRRARSSRDKPSAALYKIAAYGSAFEVLVWLVAVLSAGKLFLTFVNMSWWLGIAAGLVLAWLGLVWQPIKRPTGWGWRYAARLAPAVAWLLLYLHPITGRLGSWFKGLRHLSFHNGVYEKEDLVELLQNQSARPENRIPAAELRMVEGALTFGDKTVGSIMTPLRTAKLVNANESIGPHLMDELHASGFSRFPVVKDASKSAAPEIIGVFYIRDLVGYEGGGTVRELMDGRVYFINEAQSLRAALGAFLKTQHHLLIVVNNFEEIVGVISLEDVLEQIIGEKIIDEFDRYGDLRAVAGLEAAKVNREHKTLSAKESEVIE